MKVNKNYISDPGNEDDFYFGMPMSEYDDLYARYETQSKDRRGNKGENYISTVKVKRRKERLR